MSSPMRPSVPPGRPPPVTRVQLRPPLVLFQMPAPGPPAAKPKAVRRRVYVAAKRMSGLVGWMMRSVAPVLASTVSVRLQVRPPSVVMYTPRSGLAPKRWPTAATHTTSGFVGCTITRAMDCVSRRPLCVNVLPPSVDLYIPSPNEELWRLFGSPVPTYRMSALDGAMAMSPIECVV